MYISHQPSGLKSWFIRNSFKITHLPTLFPGLRSAPLGSVRAYIAFAKVYELPSESLQKCDANLPISEGTG